MRNARILSVAAVAIALGFSALRCSESPPPPPPVDAGCPEGDPACAPTCTEDVECGGAPFFMCSKSGKCVSACAKRADCLTHPAANGGPLPGCDTGLGCNCDERLCVPQACTDDTECGSQVCKNGKCQPADADPDSCTILPSFTVMRVGQPATFTVLATKVGAPLVLGPAAFTWTAADASVTAGSAGAFTGATASSGEVAAIRATVASKTSVTCTAVVIVYGAPTSGSLRAVVIDELSGRPLTGAVVRVNDASATEGSNGAYEAAGVAAGNATVSVFHQNFSYVTLAGVTGRDVLIPVRRNPDDLAGGYRGKFTDMSRASGIHFGMAGMSIPGSFTDLDPQTLVGSLVPSQVDFNNQAYDVDLPSGIVLGMNAKLFKDWYAAFGPPGACASPAEMAAGTCGTWSAFGLIGDISVDDAAPLITDVINKKTLDIAKALEVLRPALAGFRSSVVHDVTYKRKAVPSAGVSQLFDDPEAFTPKDLGASVALTLRHTVVLPTLPSVDGAPLDGAIILAGSMVTGRGFIPLGLSAGTAGVNGKVGEDGATDGKLTLRMAPNHSGLEGSRYGVISLALPTQNLDGGLRGTSGLIDFRAKVPYGQTIDYGQAPFLAFSDQGHYDFRAGTYGGAALVSGATLHRLVFRSSGNRLWIVYFKGASFSVPRPPDGYEDRTMADGQSRDPSVSANSDRALIQIHAVKAASASAPLGLEEIFAFNGTNSDSLASFTSAFSVYDFARPKIDVVLPSRCDGLARCDFAAATDALAVRVRYFRVPADGKVELSESGGAFVQLADAVDAGGVASLPLTGLSAGDHTLLVRLVDPSGAPLDPSVRTMVDVTIR